MKEVKAFFDSTKEDRDIQDRLLQAKDQETFIRVAAEVAKERGFAVTEADIKAFITARQAQLPDEELEKVAGGVNFSGVELGGPIDVSEPSTWLCPNPYTNSVVYPDVCGHERR